MRLLLRNLLSALLFVLYASSQCCLRSLNSLCVECPLGMHLYRSNCIVDLPGCLSYSNGFDCTQCKIGYFLDPGNKTCIIKSGFLRFATQNFQDFTNNPKNSALISDLKELTTLKLPNSTDGLTILKAYLASTEPNAARLIFTNNVGFVEVLFELKSPTNGSVLLDSKVTVIKDTEDFIDTNDDIFMSYVLAQVQKNYIELSNFQIIDGFRSLDVLRGLAIYRVFLLDPNVGLREISVVIKIGNEVQLLDIKNLPSQIKLVVDNFTTTSPFATYLTDSVLVSVRKTTAHPQERVTYNATYKHPKIILDQGPAISWLIFQSNSSKNSKILDSYMYLKENEHWNDPTALNFEALNDIIFVEYLDPSAVKNVNAYASIVSALQYFSDYTSNSYISRAAVGQNSSILAYEIQYSQIEKGMINTFTFIVAKSSLFARINKLVQVSFADRQINALSDRTRASILSTLDGKSSSIVQTLMYTEALYSEDSKLVQVVRDQAKNIKSSNLVENVTRIVLKYYYPSPSSNEAGRFEYVSFRYEIDSNQNLNILGHIQTPVETFEATNDTSYTSTLLNTINKTLLSNVSLTRADVSGILASQNRSYAFNVLLNQTYASNKYSSNLYFVAGNETYELKQTDLGDAPPISPPAPTNSTPNVTPENATLSQSQIMQSSTVPKLLDFISMQFILEVQSKIVVEVNQVNKLNDAYTIYDILYAEPTSGFGFRLVLGIATQFGNIVILETTNPLLDQKIINQGKQRYKKINKDLMSVVPGNNNPSPKIQNQTIVLTPAQLAIKLVPSLVSMYTSLTSTPINNDSLTVSATNTTLLVQEPSLRQYEFDVVSPLPKISILEQPRLTVSSHLTEDALRKIITEMVGIDGGKIATIRVTSRTTLLDILDTYVVQFSEATAKAINSTNPTPASPTSSNSTLNKNKENSTSNSINQNSNPKIVSDGIIPLLPNSAKVRTTTTSTPSLALNRSNTSESSTVNKTPIPILVSASNNAPTTQTVMFQIAAKANNISNSSGLLLTRRMSNDYIVILDSIVNILPSLFSMKPIAPSTPPAKNVTTSASTNSSTVFQFIPLQYSQSRSLSLPPRSSLGPQTVLTQSNQLPELILRRYARKLYAISKRTVTNSSVVLYVCMHYKYGLMNIWYDSKTDLLIAAEYADAGYYLSGADYIDMEYIIKEASPVERTAAADLTVILGRVNLPCEFRPKHPGNLSVPTKNLVLWKVKSVEKIKQIELWYEIQSLVIRLNYLLANWTDGVPRLTMVELEPYDNNFTSLRNSNFAFKQEQIAKISNTSQFKECEKLLKLNDNINFYLRNSDIIDIMAKEYNSEIQYYVIYSTSYGPVDARLAYSTRNKTARLMSFTEPKQRPTTGTDKGCILAAGTGCKECSKEYYLHKDARCYARIPGCTSQNGGYCLQCDAGMQKSASRCE